MANKGAPGGNQYAKKADTGKTISLYLPSDDMALLRQILQDRGEDATDAACVKLAKMGAKSGIYQLLLAKKSESNENLMEALRDTVDKLVLLVRQGE